MLLSRESKGRSHDWLGNQYYYNAYWTKPQVKKYKTLEEGEIGTNGRGNHKMGCKHSEPGGRPFVRVRKR